jgi:hypothetical protein
LLSKGRNADAKAVLVKYHANGNPSDEFVKFEYAEIEGVIAEETAIKTTWSTLWKTPGN